MPTLTVVIPAYNEERFIGTLVEQVKAVPLASLGVDVEIIVVDDCSTDRTHEIVRGIEGVRLLRLARNSGKGAAVREGIVSATGDYLIIQDADLEYDPLDYVPMMRAILDRRADIVYGSRYLGKGRHAGQSWTAYIGGRSLSLVMWVTTGKYLTDTVTALKLFPRPLLKSLALETRGFETDHEITAKVIARGLRIVEVPVTYKPRSKDEGKKIGLRDWFVGARTFWKYRKG
jgi:dolichol-phosphate mannosyltransferase